MSTLEVMRFPDANFTIDDLGKAITLPDGRKGTIFILASASVVVVAFDAERGVEEAQVALIDKIRTLYSEVDCRIGHGAESGGHLEYVREQLKEIVFGEDV